MSATLEIKMPERLSPAVLAYLDALGDMTPINEAVAVEERMLFRDHIEEASRTRHKWANRLGVTPTGHLKRAYESVLSAATATGARVEITSPGISRAFRDLEIRPRAKAYLTIPADAASYGKWVKDVKAEGWRIFRPVAPGGKGASRKKGAGAAGPFRNYLMGTKENHPPRVLFWLKKKVTVPQDRDLLPGETDVAQTAKDAIMAQLKRAAAAYKAKSQ